MAINTLGNRRDVVPDLSVVRINFQLDFGRTHSWVAFTFSTLAFHNTATIDSINVTNIICFKWMREFSDSACYLFHFFLSLLWHRFRIVGFIIKIKLMKNTHMYRALSSNFFFRSPSMRRNVHSVRHRILCRSSSSILLETYCFGFSIYHFFSLLNSFIYQKKYSAEVIHHLAQFWLWYRFIDALHDILHRYQLSKMCSLSIDNNAHTPFSINFHIALQSLFPQRIPSNIFEHLFLPHISYDVCKNFDILCEIRELPELFATIFFLHKMWLYEI